MPSITIRNLDSRTKDRLRVRAAHHRHSMEEEARQILQAALTEKKEKFESFYHAIRRIIEPVGGVDLELPPRSSTREPPSFEE